MRSSPWAYSKSLGSLISALSGARAFTSVSCWPILAGLCVSTPTANFRDEFCWLLLRFFHWPENPHGRHRPGPHRLRDRPPRGQPAGVSGARPHQRLCAISAPARPVALGCSNRAARCRARSHLGGDRPDAGKQEGAGTRALRGELHDSSDPRFAHDAAHRLCGARVRDLSSRALHVGRGAIRHLQGKPETLHDAARVSRRRFPGGPCRCPGAGCALHGDSRIPKSDRIVVLHHRGGPAQFPSAARHRQHVPNARTALDAMGWGAAEILGALRRALFLFQSHDSRFGSAGPAATARHPYRLGRARDRAPLIFSTFTFQPALRAAPMATLDSKIPAGPLADKWRKHKVDIKLVNPANKRKYEVIVVGAGLAGASAASTLADLGY